MSRFLSEQYRSLSEYVPGEQPRDRRYIKLNTNESPFEPSQSVLDAVSADAVKSLRLYCDPECKALRDALARVYGVGRDNVYVANGSDDILNFAFMAFGANGVVYPDISYGFYSVFAALHGLDSEVIPLDCNFKINAADYCEKNKLVVIANPNAPTGLLLGIDAIEQIVSSNPDSVVVIDEAYVDFGAVSCLPLIEKYSNLLCVRTFSKSRSMAGARLGFAFGSAELIADLERLRYSTNPYNVNTLTQLAGVAALNDNDYYMNNCKLIEQNRQYAADGLRRLGFEVTDSVANFLFVRSNAIEGGRLYSLLRERGILVRHFAAPRLCDYNRITVGSREEMTALLDAVQDILKGEQK